MIPSTVDELRLKLRGWPVADLRVAVAAALPAVDSVTVALVADWLLSDAPDPRPPLGREQVETIWSTLQRGGTRCLTG